MESPAANYWSYGMGFWWDGCQMGEETDDSHGIRWRSGGIGYVWITRYQFYRYSKGGYQICDLPKDIVVEPATFFDG